MHTPNPYAPPQAAVKDIADPSLALTLADRGTRFAAHLLDNIILTGMVYVPLLFAAAVGGAMAQGDQEQIETVLLAALMVSLAGFIVWLWVTVRFLRQNGQSIAKRMLGIKIVRSDGTPASAARIIWLRNVVNGFISLVPLYFLVDGLFILSEPRQCLHDKLADTIVVNA